MPPNRTITYVPVRPRAHNYWSPLSEENEEEEDTTPKKCPPPETTLKTPKKNLATQNCISQPIWFSLGDTPPGQNQPTPPSDKQNPQRTLPCRISTPPILTSQGEWNNKKQTQTYKPTSKISDTQQLTSSHGAPDNLLTTTHSSQNTTDNGLKHATNYLKTQTSTQTGTYHHTSHGTTSILPSPPPNISKYSNKSSPEPLPTQRNVKHGKLLQSGNTLPSTTTTMNPPLSQNASGITNSNVTKTPKTQTPQSTKTTTKQALIYPKTNLPSTPNTTRLNSHEDGIDRRLPTSISSTCQTAIDSSAKTNKSSLAIYSQNVQGLGGQEKLEWITRLMRKKN